MQKMSAINVMVDSEDKEKATAILKDCGVSMSTFINMAIKQLIRVQGIPFDVSVRPYINEDQKQFIKFGEEKFNNLKNGKIL